MKRILSIFFLFGVLAGCVSTHMNKGLQELSGKDIKTPFQFLAIRMRNTYMAMKSCTFGARNLR
jgi:hypothetical protein